MILWEGPSAFDGKPIVVLATGYDRLSSNAKTGPVIQTYVLYQDEHPREAIDSGADASICGACPARGQWCYASIGHAGQGLSAIWKAYKRGAYSNKKREWINGRKIRFGAYGDPAAAPLLLWEDLANHSAGWTGFTHAWRGCNPGFKRLLMASVDSSDEYYIAKIQGWRCYRVVSSKAERLKGETLCPHYTTGIQCTDCGFCDGRSRESVKGDVFAVAHGAAAGRFDKYKQQEGQVA